MREIPPIAQCSGPVHFRRPALTDWSETVTQGWDYVIVGAGSGGATLAARLSEDPSAQVLLIEAGPDFRSARTPAQFRTREADTSTAHNPEFWWPGLTAQRSPVQPEHTYLQGRGTGGSSTVNGLCAIRGIPDDYDGWARAGAKGWSFEEVLPAFVRLEDEHDFPDASYHGTGGPVPVYREPVDGWGGVDLAFRDAALDAGYAWAEDHNSPAATGVSPFAMNIRRGRRVSVNDGYLEGARRRPNLTIRGSCFADTLTFSPRRRTAVTGVRLAGGELVTGGEVIVACGAAHSPALLMRSGIGPARDLARLGIDVVADLPVGRRLQDHTLALIKLPTRPDARRCLGHRRTNCVLRYSSGLAGAGANDMTLLVNNGSTLGHSWMVVQQQQVFSRGRLTLRSRDAAVEPFVELGLLTDERDRARIRDGLERAAHLLSQRALRAVLDGQPELPAGPDLPGVITSTEHLCGTCPMGAADGQSSVVDPECRVLGVAGLRVIDSSVIPEIPRANLHLTVVMIAEHMAMRIVAPLCPQGCPVWGNQSEAGSFLPRGPVPNELGQGETRGDLARAAPEHSGCGASGAGGVCVTEVRFTASMTTAIKLSDIAAKTVWCEYSGALRGDRTCVSLRLLDECSPGPGAAWAPRPRY
jgi:5-(hydroxymethyl)furfural/furfural oxidase